MEVPLNEATLDQQPAAQDNSFRDSRWKARWLLIGAAVLLLSRATAYIDREWLAQLPAWPVVLVGAIVPHLFLLVFPLVTAESSHRPSLRRPPARRLVVEFGIAVSVVAGILILLAIVGAVVQLLAPDKLVNNETQRMARSPSRPQVYFLLLFSFLVAPISEEIFFRGFLHNALRARLPLLVATIMQTLLFGFAHIAYGVLHAFIAFVLGLVLTLVYEWRGTLVAPVIVHGCYNSVVALATLGAMAINDDSPMLGIVGSEQDELCVVRQIVVDSAADRAGLQVGDTIVSFAGEPVRNFPHLARLLTERQVGDSITLVVMRGREQVQITVVLQRRGPPRAFELRDTNP